PQSQTGNNGLGAGERSAWRNGDGRGNAPARRFRSLVRAAGAVWSRFTDTAYHLWCRASRPERVVMNAPFQHLPKSYPEVIAGGLRTACIGRAEFAQLMVKECHEARAVGRTAPKL